MNKLLFISLFLFNTYAFNFGNNFGLDIDHSPQWRTYRDNQKLEVSKCEIELFNSNVSLNSKGQLEKAFDIVLEVDPAIGKQINVLRKNNEVSINEFTAAIRRKYGIDNKTSALYIHEEKAIYVNSSDELGLLVIFLYHEISHALDSKIEVELSEVFKLYDQYSENYQMMQVIATERGHTGNGDFSTFLSDTERVILSNEYRSYINLDQLYRFRAERFAFTKQDTFVNRLFTNYSCYQDYIEEHKKLNGLKLFVETPDSYIFDAYGINSSILE